MNAYLLQTKRLRLRHFVPKDALFIIELLNSPGWLQYIGDRNIHTEEAAKKYLLTGPVKSYADNGFGLCLVERKEDNACIGMMGFVKRDILDFPDIGFAFLPRYQKQGYAFEMASKLLIYAKEKLRIQTIYAITVADNEASIRLINKLGLRYIKELLLPTGEATVLLYSNNE